MPSLYFTFFPVDNADFISIDGEFTGLHNEESKNSALDTPAERYAKTRKSVNKFLLVQFGLCTFRYDKKKKKYTNQAFNFYVWPRPYSRYVCWVKLSFKGTVLFFENLGALLFY